MLSPSLRSSDKMNEYGPDVPNPSSLHMQTGPLARTQSQMIFDCFHAARISLVGTDPSACSHHFHATQNSIQGWPKPTRSAQPRECCAS